MNYIIKGHNFINEIQTITQVFYPNEKFISIDYISADGLTVVSELELDCCKSKIYNDGMLTYNYSLPVRGDIKHCVKKSMFLCLVKGGYFPAWGMLTGIRPSKLVHVLWNEGCDDINRYMWEEYFVSRSKSALCIRVAEAEKRVLMRSPVGGHSIYIGIPFCPSRCLYCSFTSYPISKYSVMVDAYLAALEKEIVFARNMCTNLDTVYIGGGTPTVLNPKQLERLLVAVNTLGHPREYTVEAGRPDTIDSEKLKLLKDYGVTRLSINPQTMNDDTLHAIGRAHTRACFLNAFDAARACGHVNINVDLILGLPGECADDVCASLKSVLALEPENLTVHTLAIKRASRLKEQLNEHVLTVAGLEEMLEFTESYTSDAQLYPYYMYRQKNMLGNFENVGYAKIGFECIYNVQIMSERQSILALGAGAVSKTVDLKTGRIERIFNVKSVEDYITRIDEMVERKGQYYEQCYTSATRNKGYI